jgi:hypothetical protein
VRREMNLTISLSPDQEQQHIERAVQSGKDPVDYVRDLIDRTIQGPTLDEVLAPFRRQVEASGMSDDSLGAFFEEVREEVWQVKQAKASRLS